MGVWDTSTPAGSDPISQGDDRIRELKTAIQDSLRGGVADGLEAVFPGAAPSTAPIFHYRGLKGSTAARPAATEGGLYFNTTTGTLQRADGSVWLDLTENAAYEAIHQAVGASLASVTGVVTLPETGNSFNVSGAEAVTSLAGWSTGVVIIQWLSARTLTHASTFYLRGAVSRQVSANDISIFEFNGANSVREISMYGPVIQPTRQVFTSGSGTYTTPARVTQLRVRLIAGGGGGGSTGGTGGSSSFNSIAATGGSGGSGVGNSGVGGVGGTGGAGSASFRIAGGDGGSSVDRGGSDNDTSGAGGQGAFGGGGPAVNAGKVGVAGKTNSGGGGSGNSGDGSNPGGGAGEYLEYIITTPAATYSYAVGAAGAAGTNGAAGGSGLVVVDEIY